MTRPKQRGENRSDGGSLAEAGARDPHRWARATRTVVLFALTMGVLGYLLLPGRTPATARTEEAFCTQIAQMAGFAQALADLNPTAVRNAMDGLEKLESVAPAEITPSVKVIVDTSKALVEPVQQAQSDETAIDRAWRRLQPEVARIQAAGKALGGYAAAHCKIDLATVVNTATSTTSPTATSTTSPPATSKASPPATSKASPAATSPPDNHKTRRAGAQTR